MRMNHNSTVIDLNTIAATFPGIVSICMTNIFYNFTTLTDLTSEERQLLLDIRRRKAELLAEITQLKDEIKEISTEIDAMDTEEGAKQKNLAMGKKKFNMDPKKGIEFLILHGSIKETPEEVAQFLYKEEGLNKTAIGDYLGEKNDFNEAVLKAFVELHDFTDLILVQALRQFLWSFRLPGEAQKSSSHFHCLKCDYYCTDTNKVVAHRRQHQKLDSIMAAGFEKFTPTQFCTVAGCAHNGKQTHYHCRQCQYAVLGLSQMEAHKFRHMNE